MASKATLEKAMRNEVLSVISQALSEHFDVDVEAGSASTLIIPVLDAERNEKFAKITVQIPRGTRNGEGGYIPYDGYAEIESYKQDMALKEEEKRAKAEIAAREKAEKERKRAAKKTIKELNEKGLKKMIEEADTDDHNQFLPSEVAI